MTSGERPTAPIRSRDRDAATPERPRADPRRRRLIVGVVAAVILAVAAGAIAGGGGGDIPPRVSVGGIDIGGLDAQQARARLEAGARERMAGTVRVTDPDGGEAQRIAASVLVTDARIDEALAEARDSRGRVGRALARLGLAPRKEIPLRFEVREEALARLTRDARARLDRPARNAGVSVTVDAIVTTPSRQGRRVDAAALAGAVAALPAEVAVPTVATDPAVGEEDARRARDVAVRVTSVPRTVTLGDASAELSSPTLREALRFPVTRGELSVVLAPAALRAALLGPLDVRERAPADARLEIRGARVVVVPGVAGRRLNARALGTAIMADPDAPTVAAKVRTQPPALTTAEARALRIRERVSSFTTPYTCCPPRVTNIRRAAEILDGRIIPAGARFSLNDALGERTPERGFVKAPTIAAGELVDSYGGGVSQVATTMYNAAFFAGLALERHTPHEFYISRYPMGREATISWRTPDLVFRNDWNAAILIDVVAASNGVTVTFYSSRLGRRVETTTGTPTDRTSPKTIERPNPDLEPGTREVIQSAGPGGFSISYTRAVYRGDERIRDETFRWRYRPENAIVEVGPPAPEKPATPMPGGQRPDPAKPPSTTPTTPTTPAPDPPPVP